MSRPWTQQELERLVKLLGDGWNADMIARALNRTVEEVRRKITELQIKPPRR